MRIGELARRTGLTVRTLRYYEEVGLFGPADRSPSGQRIYGPADVERLYQVALLRSLGLPLDDVRAGLASDPESLRTLMDEHIASLDAQLAAQQRLRSRLAHVVDQLDSPADTTGALLNVLEDMTMTQPMLDQRISILVYADIDAAFDHLITVFGLGPGEISRDDDGNAVHAALRAGDGEVWLHPSPSSSVSRRRSGSAGPARRWR
jgi:MerR family transcriptional regulator, thiopeptide resistance regulator